MRGNAFSTMSRSKAAARPSSCARWHSRVRCPLWWITDTTGKCQLEPHLPAGLILLLVCTRQSYSLFAFTPDGGDGYARVEGLPPFFDWKAANSSLCAGTTLPSRGRRSESGLEEVTARGRLRRESRRKVAG